MKLISSLLFALSLSFNAFAQDTLFIYGPGGPLAPMQECAELFSKKFSIPVKIKAGPESKWIEEAKQKADIIFGGAEYMLTQFAMQHPGMIDSSSRIALYKRAAGILVRPGNPKKIKSFTDLAKPGIRLLDVNGAGQIGMWEDIAGKQNLIAGIQKNILHSFANTALAIDAWKNNPSYDAWIIYASWHFRLKEETSLVKLPPSQTVYRGTPVALTTITDQKEAAKKFLHFLQSQECHRIFIEWGWE